ncbi:MAG: molybdopterin-dependent oxidoreductase [Vulcanimicrobiota bacterium]
MAVVTLTINGTSCTADDSRTILQVVRDNGIDDIPTLCYEERLEPITACFLCVVEVEGARTLVPSCSTKVQQGMVVHTRTPRILESRKTCLELLFSDHYADCISPCAMKCPGGVDIQGYVALARKGLYREAVELIKERNPLPIVCGRVCVRECEVGCRRNLIDAAVGIDHIKRFAAESEEGFSFREKAGAPVGKSVGIIGAGPAGLSASYYLARGGYEVTIYEAMDRPGGMLLYGIPAYRLPKELLAREIDMIKSMGVKIECNTRLGKELTLDALRKKHAAVLLTQGAWGSSAMRVENEGAPGVLSGIQMLRDAACGTLKELTGRVLVVGGGNTAIDAARSSVRLGAKETVIVYRRTEKEMPAHHDEVEAARKEGVQFMFLTAPKKVVTDEAGRAKGLECTKMELGAPDASGRRKPVEVKGSEFIVEGDWTVAAIGQYPDLSGMESGDTCDAPCLSPKGCIKVDEETMATNLEGVFSAGDVVTGPATVIEGIAGGRRASGVIHCYLTGGALKGESREFFMTKETLAPLTKDDLTDVSTSERHCMPERPPEECVCDFKEVELGLSRNDMECESERCLSCGCNEINDCVLRKYAAEYSIKADYFHGKANRYPADKRHPLIQIDASKCIKCGRCIRTCEKILDASALGFINRGFTSVISPAMGKGLLESNCVSCGNCIDSCPTGALAENLPVFARIAEKVRETPSVCSFCSLGCSMKIQNFGRDIRIRAMRDRLTGEGDYLCKKGRFGSRYLAEGDRLKQPFSRSNGKIQNMDWSSALANTAARLKEIKDKYGPDSIGVFVSPRLTSEEIYGAVKLAKGIIGTDCIGSLRDLVSGSRHHELDSILGRTCSTAKLSDIESCDTVLLVNADPVETHPTLGWSIREARRRGKKVIVINSIKIPLASDADLWIQPRRGTLTHLLSSLMKEIIRAGLHDKAFTASHTERLDHLENFLQDADSKATAPLTGVSPEEIEAAASMISRGNIVALYDMDATCDRSRDDLTALLQLLLLTGNAGKKGAGLLLLEPFTNTVGLYDMGAEPGYLPGRVPFSDNEGRSRLERSWGLTLSGEVKQQSLEERLASGGLKGALVVGENPAADPNLASHLKDLQFLAVCDLFNTETTEIAEIILPASTHIESGGSYTRLDGEIQHFDKALNPPGGLTTLQIIARLSALLGKEGVSEDYQSTFSEIAGVIPFYQKGAQSLTERLFSDGRKTSFGSYLMESGIFSGRMAEYDSISLRYERAMNGGLTQELFSSR